MLRGDIFIVKTCFVTGPTLFQSTLIPLLAPLIRCLMLTCEFEHWTTRQCQGPPQCFRQAASPSPSVPTRDCGVDLKMASDGARRLRGRRTVFGFPELPLFALQHVNRLSRRSPTSYGAGTTPEDAELLEEGRAGLLQRTQPDPK